MDTNSHHYPQNEEQLTKLLEDSGINPTSQRLEIAGIFLIKPQHLSADQLLELAQQRGANVSKATVYNTLNLFASKGLLKELIIDGNKVFFDSNTSEHYHFFNEQTSELTDFETHQLSITSIPEPPAGMVRTGVDVIVKVKRNT